MKRIRSTSVFSSLVAFVLAVLVAMGGCTTDSLTGPDVQKEDVTLQAENDNDNGGDDPDTGHNLD